MATDRSIYKNMRWGNTYQQNTYLFFYDASIKRRKISIWVNVHIEQLPEQDLLRLGNLYFSNNICFFEYYI